MIGAWTRVRIVIFGLLLAIPAALIVRRTVELQVHEGDRFREFAEGNYLKEIEIPPQRGRVLDRNGAELATTAEFDSIYCNPRQLAGVPEAARKLGRALGRDWRGLQKTLAQRRYFAWLARRVTPDVAERVQALGLPGVGVRKEPTRVYPNGALAATVIGHAGIDGRGLDGVELAFDRYLRGNGRQVTGLRDAIGRDLLVDGTPDAGASKGQDLVLTLDRYLTHVTEGALARAVEKHRAKAGVAIAMDPRTGEILALANLPTYSPNEPGDASARGARNRAVTDQFEPGSTFKTFTFAAALDAGEVRPEKLIDCQMGKMLVGGRVIKDDHPKGILTAAEVFKHSSNIGTFKIARKLGREGLWSALVRFGFGRPTGVGLPGEQPGMLRKGSTWREIEFATHAFGQGVAVTPLQLVAGFAAVASGGVYRAPRIALRVVRNDGRAEALGPAARDRGAAAADGERVMSEAAARTLLEIMEGVTEKGGTAERAAIDGYPVGGKTGTAQKVTNGRYGDKRVSSFVGIVPADDPRLVIGVVVDEPVGIAYGGLIAAPVFKEIAEAALRYYGIPPRPALLAARKDGKAGARKRPAPAVKEEGAAAGESAAAEGLGSDLPTAVAAAEEGEEALAAADAGQGEGAGDGAEAGEAMPDLVPLPDFRGMSIGQAIRAARRAGVDLLPEGSGTGFAQTPAPGLLPRGTMCRVSFRPGG